MTQPLDPSPRLNDFARAMREQFGRAIPWNTVLLVALGVTVFALFVWVLNRWQESRALPRPPNRPYHVFRSLMKRLKLTGRQRQILIEMANGPGKVNPITILISERVFDRCVSRWTPRGTQRAERFFERPGGSAIEQLRNRLFPRTDLPATMEEESREFVNASPT